MEEEDEEDEETIQDMDDEDIAHQDHQTDDQTTHVLVKPAHPAKNSVMSKKSLRRVEIVNFERMSGRVCPKYTSEQQK